MAGTVPVVQLQPMRSVGMVPAAKAAQLMALVALGVVLYFGSLVLLGFRPRHFKRSEMQ